MGTITVQSVSTPVFGTTDVTLTKPASLAAGDLLIVIAYKLTGTSPSSPTGGGGGWSVGRNIAGTSVDQKFFWKIADSSDVAASSFTLGNGDSAVYAGSIIRITGHDPTTPISSTSTDWPGQNTTSTTTTPSFTSLSVTPTIANSLLIFIGTSYNNSSNAMSWSSLSIATSNPTWTEAFDVARSDGTERRAVTVYYATRAQTTATGTATGTVNTNGTDFCGTMLFVNPNTSSPSSSASSSPSTSVSSSVSSSPSSSISSSPSSSVSPSTSVSSSVSSSPSSSVSSSASSSPSSSVSSSPSSSVSPSSSISSSPSSSVSPSTSISSSPSSSISSSPSTSVSSSASSSVSSSPSTSVSSSASSSPSTSVSSSPSSSVSSSTSSSPSTSVSSSPSASVSPSPSPAQWSNQTKHTSVWVNQAKASL